MDAFEIIRKTMEEFADVPDDTVQAFISLAEPLIRQKEVQKVVSAGFGIFSGT